ncbi:MAG: helix-turn-helix transcriptional regulator, partial [Candidatus Methanomethylophilaceae archaeon]|nr:helix-turn-helix transcriptional regulator [Candidatus Methanomethylophilaceae archaeon]
MAKDSLWLLCDPVAAYKEWMRLLAPGGRMMILDGNYHLHQFNPDYGRRKEYLNLRDGKDNNLHARTNVNHVDLSRIDAIAEDLPLSKEVRPAWDVGQLLGLGMKEISVRSWDRTPFSVLTENGPLILPFGFDITATKDVRRIGNPPAVHMDQAELEWIRSRISSRRRDLEGISSTFSGGNRVAILYALYLGPMDVGSICRATGMTPSAVSHSLGVLRGLGVVVAERDAKTMVYRLSDDDGLGTAVRAVFDSMSMSRDARDGFRPIRSPFV